MRVQFLHRNIYMVRKAKTHMVASSGCAESSLFKSRSSRVEQNNNENLNFYEKNTYREKSFFFQKPNPRKLYLVKKHNQVVYIFKCVQTLIPGGSVGPQMRGSIFLQDCMYRRQQFNKFLLQVLKHPQERQSLPIYDTQGYVWAKMLRGEGGRGRWGLVKYLQRNQ